jgi:glutathione S-transferase
MDTLYDSRLSGNGWKIRLLLGFLARPYRRVVLDLTKGEARTAEFLRLNPLARVPVFAQDDGTVLRESNAILVFLARGTAWWPADAREQAEILQWLFFEQFDHLRYLARPRFLVSIAKTAAQFETELGYLRPIGEKALGVLEQALSRSSFLAGERCSIADIALFPYSSMAEMGGYDLEPYAAIRTWIDRIRELPGFVPLLDAGA